MGHRSRAAGLLRRAGALLTLVAALSGLLAAQAPAAGATGVGKPGHAHVIAGPSGQLSSLDGMSIARDGTGGLVYTAQDQGAGHVFVSRLVGGVFQTPVRVDAGLGGTSSEPVLAAGNGGLLVVAFINAGNLYAVETPGSSAGFGSPLRLHAGASHPSLQMSNWGKAYLAFTASLGSSRFDVDAEYWNDGAWQAVSAPLNVTPGDNAGTGAGRPVVATAGDGVGIVAWGENGHVYARRAWGTSPSVVDERLDPATFGGATEVSGSAASGSPAISVGGDSSYPEIAFDETLASGAGTWNRVLMTRLISEDVGPTVAIDGLSSTVPGSASLPALAMNEYGRGVALASDDTSGQLMDTPLSSNGFPGSPGPISQGTSASPLLGVPAVAGINWELIAWEQSVNPGPTEVLLRYGPTGPTLPAPIVLSAASAQPQPADGLAAAGDNGGDAAVAWIQGSPGSLTLQATQIYQPPGPAQPTRRFAYTRTAQPSLSWSPAADRWGPITYRVALDSGELGPTTATSLQVPTPLIDGPHTWQVTASNPAALTSTGRSSTVFVDTTAPQVVLSLSGKRRTKRMLTLHITAVDQPAAEPGAQASGIASVRVSWGDGSPSLKGKHPRTAQHIYARKGVYRITVRARDRAGNRRTATLTVRIRRK